MISNTMSQFTYYDNTNCQKDHVRPEATVDCKLIMAKQLYHAADFLDKTYDFNFIDQEKKQSESPKPSKYTSHCPFIRDSAACLTLSWDEKDNQDMIAGTPSFNEYRKECKTRLRIHCSETTGKNQCVCMAQKRFDGIYAELYAFCYYLYLKHKTNSRKNIEYLVGTDKFDEVYRKPLAIVEAPTGCGKTFQAVNTAIRIVMEENRIAVLAFPTRKLLIQTGELIQKRLETASDEVGAKPSDIAVYQITMAEDTRFSTLNRYFMEALGCCEGKPRKPTIVLTLHSYFRFKGDAPEVSSFAGIMLKYSKQIWLSVDEAHTFVNSCTWKMPYECMLIGKRDVFSKSSILKQIPWSIKDLATKNLCRIEILTGILYRSQEDQGGKVWKLSPFGKHNPIEYSLDFEQINNEDKEVLLNTTTSTKRIVQEANPYETLMTFKTTVVQWVNNLISYPNATMDLLDPSKWISFLLSVSYRPCVIFYKPYSKKYGKRITLEEYARYHQKRYDSKIDEPLPFTEDEDEDEENDCEKKRTKLTFPKGNLPFTSEITAMNMFPVFLATQCSTCIFISATLQEYHSKFIKLCLEDQQKEICHVSITTGEDRKLDQLVFVVTKANWFNIFKKNFWLQIVHICQELSDFYTIGFCENQRQAKKFYDWLSTYSINQILILAGNEIQGNKTNPESPVGYDILSPIKLGEDHDKSPPKLGIASAMGVVGTGLNMPERKLVLFNMGLFRPISAFWHCETPEEAKELLIQDLISSVQQTLGRNMRKSAIEMEGKAKANRVTVLMGIENFPGCLAYLEVLARKSFKIVTTIPLNEFEKRASDVSKSVGAANTLEEAEDPNFTEEGSALDRVELAEGLSRVDNLRLKAVNIMSSWLQGHLEDVFTLKYFREVVENSKLLESNRVAHFTKKITEWRQQNPDRFIWREVMRKFNLSRESEAIRTTLCFNILTEMENDTATAIDTNTSQESLLERIRKTPGRKKGSPNKTAEEKMRIQAEKKPKGRPRKQN